MSVTDINSFKKKQKDTDIDEIEQKPEYSFAEIVEQNRLNAIKMKEERAKNNKKVTRSYKLKK